IFEDCKKSANTGCKEKVSIKRDRRRGKYEETIYYQKSIEAIVTGHMIVVIKSRFENNIKAEKEILIKYQELDKVNACAETKLDQKEEVRDKDDLKE
ncbi:4167_t:CDS:1, partial [Gigaspora rosea]